MPHVERLRQLHRVVSNIDLAEFSMGIWRGRVKACALGHACADPWHKDAGLTFEDDWPVFEGLKGYHAAACFYGLSREQTLHIFSVATYPNHRVLSGVRNLMLVRIAELIPEADLSSHPDSCVAHKDQ